MKHKYVENISLSSVAGALTSYVWKANSLYDPNQTGGGHQPLYFDQMATMYNHYTVIGSRFRVSFAEGDATHDVVPCYCGVFLDDDTSIAGLNYLDIQEQSLGKSCISAADTRQRNVNMTYKWSAKKMFGGSILANPQLTGQTNSDPAELSYYRAWFAPADGSATVAKYLRIEIEYIAVWRELKDIPAS